MKIFLPINIKMPTIVGILISISGKISCSTEFFHYLILGFFIAGNSLSSQNVREKNTVVIMRVFFIQMGMIFIFL